MTLSDAESMGILLPFLSFFPRGVSSFYSCIEISSNLFQSYPVKKDNYTSVTEGNEQKAPIRFPGNIMNHTPILDAKAGKLSL